MKSTSDKIISYENGSMSYEDSIVFFAELIKSKMTAPKIITPPTEIVT